MRDINMISSSWALFYHQDCNVYMVVEELLGDDIQQSQIIQSPPSMSLWFILCY